MKIEISNLGCLDITRSPALYALYCSDSKALLLKEYNEENTTIKSTKLLQHRPWTSLYDFRIPLEQEAVSCLLKNRIKSIELDKVSTIYIAPDSIVPRHRLKELKEKYNISVTRDYTKANLIVLGETSFNKNVSSIYTSGVVKTKTLREILYPELMTYFSRYYGGTSKLGSNPLRSSVYADLVTFRNEIELTMNDEIPEYLYMEYSTKRKLDDVLTTLGLVKKDFYEYIHGGRIMVITKEEKIKNILELFDRPFMLDSDFVSIFGESIIDDDSYKFINNLLESDNDENIQVALTIMSNCNFEKSHGYLLLLYYQHETLIYQEYRKLVSYKSLYMFLNKHTVNNIDRLIEFLDTNGFLTDSIKTHLKEIYISEKKLDKTTNKRIVIKNIEIEII